MPADSPYPLKGYPGYRTLVTSASTIRTNTSASSQTIEYDAEAAQVKGHPALYGRMHSLKKASSLGKKDVGIFQSYLEKDPTERRAVSGIPENLKSNEHNHISSKTPTIVLQDDIPKVSPIQEFAFLVN